MTNKKVIEVRDCRNCKYGGYNDHWGTNFCHATKYCVDWNLWEPSDKIYEEQEPHKDYTNKQKEIKNALEQLNLGPEEDVTEEYNNAVDIAIEALELQFPDEWETEKFNPSYFSYTEPKIVYICPNCNGVADDAYKYCPYCGKAKIKKEIKDL